MADLVPMNKSRALRRIRSTSAYAERSRKRRSNFC